MRRIADLSVGDRVYSVDNGRIAAVPILRTQRVPAPGHVVRRIELASGEVVEMSNDHPTADGRTFGEIAEGDSFDGVAVVAASTVPFAHAFTVDILPGSDSGTYYAAGVLVGSTMALPRGVVSVAPSSR